MEISHTPIQDVYIVKSKPFLDHRGSFTRFFCNDLLSSVLKDRQVVQINNSITINTGSIRGLHYQIPPHSEMKLVRCIQGRIFDVAVDLRSNSSTYLQWFGVELSPDQSNMLVIPEGCAHGFQSLEEDSELIYLSTTPYTPKSERGISPLDPALSIPWPLPISDISEKDSSHPLITSDFPGIIA